MKFNYKVVLVCNQTRRSLGMLYKLCDVGCLHNVKTNKCILQKEIYKFNYAKLAF